MLHRKGRCWSLRLCMTCGKLMWFNRATFTECGPNTENAYHPGKCSVTHRPLELMKQERSWHQEVLNRSEKEPAMASDTKRLDWYFGQERFVISRRKGGFIMFDNQIQLYTNNSEERIIVYRAAREAIDHAMEQKPADGE